jgi:outer membrane protein assembly factor BamB
MYGTDGTRAASEYWTMRRYYGNTLAMLRPLACFLLAITAAVADTNWTQFRGPRGDGSSDSTGLPVTFSENEHVKWKTPIHGKAWSSPVIWGSQVWMTTANEQGTELGVVCVDKETGKILQDKILFRVADPQFCHKFNSYASPTPSIEEGRLYVSFGSPGICAVDTKTGEMLWERRDFVCNHYRGAGSSPVIFENLLLQQFDGSDKQYVVALDKKTGKTVWEVNRSVDYQDLQPDGKTGGGGRLAQGFRDTARLPVAGEAADALERGESALRLRSADGKGDLAL